MLSLLGSPATFENLH